MSKPDFAVAISRPLTSVGRQRREHILCTARKMFAVRGFHGTSMDDLADSAGLNKATLYYYYARKSLLLFDIYGQVASATMSAVRSDPNSAPRLVLQRCTVNLLQVIAADPDGAAVYFQESPYIGEWFTKDQVDEIRRAEAFVYEQIRDVIDRGVAVEEFRSCDSHVLALGYIGMTLGSHRWLTPGSPEGAVRIANEINRVLWRGLSRPNLDVA